MEKTRIVLEKHAVEDVLPRLERNVAVLQNLAEDGRDEQHKNVIAILQGTAGHRAHRRKNAVAVEKNRIIVVVVFVLAMKEKGESNSNVVKNALDLC